MFRKMRFALLLMVPLTGVAAPPTNEELQRQLDIVGQEVQKLKLGGAAEATADQMQYGLGPAASKVYRTQSGFSIGGYGELVFESFRRGSYAPYGRDSAANRVDLRRLILYSGYKFNDSWVMNSELEWEHGGDELAVEFLYFDHFVSSRLNYRFGKLLMPMGITNEIHEPVTFMGSHRPLTETLIIPSTWTEFGAGIFGDLGTNFTYRTYVVSGLNAAGFSAQEGIREGRNERGESNGTRFAWVGRLDYTGSVGLTAGGSLYVGAATPKSPTDASQDFSVPAAIVEAHAHLTRGSWDLRSLVAYSNFSRTEQLNPILIGAGNGTFGSEQLGAYAQAGYELLEGGQKSVMPFIRHEIVNTQVSVAGGFARSDQTLIYATALGVGYKPIAQIVIKGDFEWFKTPNRQGVDQLNFSVGYVF